MQSWSVIIDWALGFHYQTFNCNFITNSTKKGYRKRWGGKPAAAVGWRRPPCFLLPRPWLTGYSGNIFPRVSSLAKDFDFLPNCHYNLWTENSPLTGRCSMSCVQGLCLVYHARLTKPGVFTRWEKRGWTTTGQSQETWGLLWLTTAPLSDFALFLVPAPK